MAHFLIFSSATDGNWMIKLLQQNGVEVCLSIDPVSNFTAPPGLHVFKEPVEVEDLATLLQSLQFDCAIDMSYAGLTEQCEKRKAACAFSDIRYLRLVRTPCTGEECVYVDSGEKAAGILSATTGKALLTIGVSDLNHFTNVPNFQDRLYLRIRPSLEVMEQCLSMGFRQANLIAMEGPFSRELNGAMLRRIEASLLVTRLQNEQDITDKLLAARDAEATAVVIGKTKEDKGLTYSELLDTLEQDYYIYNQIKMGEEPLFPLFMNLTDRKIAIFGGSAAAARKAEILLGFSKHIAAIAPQFDPAFDHLETVRIERPYLRGDCAGYQYVFALTGNKEVNRTIAEEAHAAGVLVYSEDGSTYSDFHFPEILHRNHVVIGAYFMKQERKAIQSIMNSIAEKVDGTLMKK